MICGGGAMAQDEGVCRGRECDCAVRVFFD